MVSFLGVAVFVCLLELRRGWWALPPLALLWANCHGGFPLGWVVLLAYCAGTLPLRPAAAWARDSRRLWLVTVCAIVASGVNPDRFRSSVHSIRLSPEPYDGQSDRAAAALASGIRLMALVFCLTRRR